MIRPVTVDTGGADDVFKGALLTWLHTPRGGYGYTVPVDAIVLGYGIRPRTWVQIEVAKANGDKVKRRVEAVNLRWRAR